ncbi:MAG: flavin reductase family protein [Candidatus Eremiobacteraeota bacterium]|nr:flavin reductase family protein [Candidatus Eremiobacteraeota bacterium]
MAAVSVDAFKEAMRRFPSGVTVVTSVKNGEPRGVTVSAFASVSLEPPTILICVNREARSYLFISTSKIFCVNILSADQQQLAERFAARIREKQFEGVPYSIDQTGAAVLSGVLAHLDCEVVEEHHAGSHSVFIGRVVSLDVSDGSPLGYFDGSYHDFALHVK